MGSHHPIRKTVAPEPTVIPDKLYFRIGDVARLCQVPTYVLRFWETEFPALKPNKGGTGQRLYRKRDVEMALRIKTLLYDQGYTIPGARQVFKAEARERETAAGDPEALPETAPAPGLVPNSATTNPAAVDMGELIRRRAQQEPHIRALRNDMLALLAQLSAPVLRATPTQRAAAQSQDPAADLRSLPSPVAALNAGGPFATTGSQNGGAPGPLLRPRLVLEPRPASRSAAVSARPEPADARQRDLFSLSSSEPGE